MKKLHIILTMAAFAFAIYACTKATDFNADNSSPTGVGSRPVSSNTLRDVATTLAVDAAKYSAAATFTTELQYFSESPVKEINLYNTVGTGTREKVGTWPYASAFSQIKRTDTLLVSYTVPAVAVGTKIKLEYEILNVNTLNLIKTATITLK